MKKIAVVMIFCLGGCTSGYQQFYRSNITEDQKAFVEPLGEGQSPDVYASNDLEKDARILMSKGYGVIGESSFNGKYEGEYAVKSQARRVGASIVLIKSEYTNTQISTTPLLMPTTSTTTHNGSVSASNGAFGTYSGSSTTYGSAVVPITTSQDRYDQSALFFAKSIGAKKAKLGIVLLNLSPEQRQIHKRNTGAFVNIVLEKTPAFYANILDGDIVLKIDGTDVKDAEDAQRLIKEADETKESIITILRGTEIKDIRVSYQRS